MLTSRASKVVIATEVFYVLGTALVKFSILFLYKRLFGANKRFKNVLWGVGAFTGAYSFVEATIAIFQCRPVNAAWNMNVHGYCVNIALGAIIIGSINVAVDFVTLILPIHPVWKLKMKMKWKLQVIGIFLLGGL